MNQNNNNRIKELEIKCFTLEKKLLEVEDRYEKLCVMVKKQANRLRMIQPDESDESDEFLFKYGVDRPGPWN
jgi:hypothetical protein